MKVVLALLLILTTAHAAPPSPGPTARYDEFALTDAFTKYVCATKRQGTELRALAAEGHRRMAEAIKKSGHVGLTNEDRERIENELRPRARQILNDPQFKKYQRFEEFFLFSRPDVRAKTNSEMGQAVDHVVQGTDVGLIHYFTGKTMPGCRR